MIAEAGTSSRHYLRCGRPDETSLFDVLAGFGTAFDALHNPENEFYQAVNQFVAEYEFDGKNPLDFIVLGSPGLQPIMRYLVSDAHHIHETISTISYIYLCSAIAWCEASA